MRAAPEEPKQKADGAGAGKDKVKKTRKGKGDALAAPAAAGADVLAGLAAAGEFVPQVMHICDTAPCTPPYLLPCSH